MAGPLSTAATLLLAATVTACAAPGPNAGLALENPAPGVYVHYGRVAIMTPDNRGDIANLGFVVGERCVAVIDTGGTVTVGRALRAAIRRITDKPVCFVINTHVHPDHVFGNAAFLADHPQFVGHAHLRQAFARRGPIYLRALERDLGAAAAGSELIAPNRAVDESVSLDLGGRTLELRAWPTAHTDQDLTVYDRHGRVLFLGDLVFATHLPVVDGRLRGMLAATAELRRAEASVFVPGHGRADDWQAVLSAQERYLKQLEAGVKAALAQRKTLAQAVASVGESERGAWDLFDEFHRRNVTAAYAELEWDE